MAKTEVTDAEVRRRIRVPKYQVSAEEPKSIGVHRIEIEMVDDDGFPYRLNVRHRSSGDFHIEVLTPFDGNWLPLIRFDGDAEHLCPLESVTITGFHIHFLTERYVREHFRKPVTPVDGYAKTTGAYSDLRSAWAYARREANIHLNPRTETTVFYRPWRPSETQS